MTNVTVPLPESLLAFVDQQVSEYRADSRAGFIRRLIAEKIETDLLEAHLAAVREHKAGTTLKGSLRDLVLAR